MSVHITTDATVVAEQGSLDNARIGYQNLINVLTNPSASASASSAEGGFPADAVQRPDTYEYWKPTSLPAWLTFDLGASYASSPTGSFVNYVAIAAHTLGSKSVNVKAQHSPDNNTWIDVSDVATPDDNSPIMLLFPSKGERYWRLYFDGFGSPTEMPTVGVVHIGAVLAMSRPIYGGISPITLSRETELHRSISRGGQFLGQSIRRVGFSGDFRWRHLSPSWYRANFDPFVEAARTQPFFVAWRPSDYPAEIVYGWTPDDIKPSNMGLHNLMEVGMRVHGYGNE